LGEICWHLLDAHFFKATEGDYITQEGGTRSVGVVVFFPNKKRNCLQEKHVTYQTGLRSRNKKRNFKWDEGKKPNSKKGRSVRLGKKRGARERQSAPTNCFHKSDELRTGQCRITTGCFSRTPVGSKGVITRNRDETHRVLKVRLITKALS